MENYEVIIYKYCINHKKMLQPGPNNRIIPSEMMSALIEVN